MNPTPMTPPQHQGQKTNTVLLVVLVLDGRAVPAGTPHPHVDDTQR